MFKTIVRLTLILASLLLPTSAYATTLEIVDNGSTSQNSVQISSQNTTGISQSNDATISNSVNNQANSGSNTASSNTDASSNINTGNVDQSNSVENKLNQSSAQVKDCGCNTNTSAEVSGNAEESQNNIKATSDNHISTEINQSANVSNNSLSQLNSGNNTSSDSTGAQISIHTGDIKVNTGVVNDLNASATSIDPGSVTSETSISGNGVGSVNSVVVSTHNRNTVVINNLALIDNLMRIMANTGDNYSDSNIGRVSIITGDIILSTLLKNAANRNLLSIDCGCVSEPPTTPPVTPPLTPPQVFSSPPGQGGISEPPIVATAEVTPTSLNSPSPGIGGQALGLATGEILPATGSFLLWLTAFAILLLAMGVYFRYEPQDAFMNNA